MSSYYKKRIQLVKTVRLSTHIDIYEEKRPVFDKNSKLPEKCIYEI